jgi:hypothetical protein
MVSAPDVGIDALFFVKAGVDEMIVHATPLSAVAVASVSISMSISTDSEAAVEVAMSIAPDTEVAIAVAVVVAVWWSLPTPATTLGGIMVISFLLLLA